MYQRALPQDVHSCHMIITSGLLWQV